MSILRTEEGRLLLLYTAVHSLKFNRLIISASDEALLDSVHSDKQASLLKAFWYAIGEKSIASRQ